MSLFVYRNNTVERFFPKDYAFSGYDDISIIPTEADGYVWFFQAPIDCNGVASVEEIRGYQQKFNYVLEQVDANKMFIGWI